MNALALFAAFLAGDVNISNAGTKIGPIITLDCQTDAGVNCVRSTLGVGRVRCTPAAAGESGCVVPGAQTMPVGLKAFDQLQANTVDAGTVAALIVNAGFVDAGTVQTQFLDAGAALITGELDLVGPSSGAAMKVKSGAIQFNGVTTGSLPACNATNYGSFALDNSTQALQICWDIVAGTYSWVGVQASTISGYNAVTTATATKVISVQLMSKIYPVVLGMSITGVGTGAGNATVTAKHGATVLGVSSAIPCASAVGSQRTIVYGFGAVQQLAIDGTPVDLIIDGTACTTTPTGNVFMQYQ